MGLVNKMAGRMGTATAYAERLLNNASDMSPEEIKKEAFGILALMQIDLDVDVTSELIGEMYKEAGHGHD